MARETASRVFMGTSATSAVGSVQVSLACSSGSSPSTPKPSASTLAGAIEETEGTGATAKVEMETLGLGEGRDPTTRGRARRDDPEGGAHGDGEGSTRVHGCASSSKKERSPSRR